MYKIKLIQNLQEINNLYHKIYKTKHVITCNNKTYKAKHAKYQ